MSKITKTKITRDELFNLLKGKNNFGVELGVALGNYSKVALDTNKFKLFIGIDSYDLGQYGLKQYKEALMKTNVSNNKYKILKMKFEDALDLFEDESLDFIYFDGFAHNGQLGGKTIVNWYNKVRIGGMIAGDDYDDQWPLVKDVVNDISIQLNQKINVTTINKKDNYSEFASWYFFKNNKKELIINHEIYSKSATRDKLEWLIFIFNPIKVNMIKLLKIILPNKIIRYLKKLRI
jgi:hypothetical protein